MKYPQITLPTIEALYRLGAQICEEIEKFQPDVVIGLAHSGWMPVVVAQALWAESRKNPFPSSTRTNIGLEKHEIYAARFGKFPPAFCCRTCSEEPGRTSHYLAWIAEQSTWLNTLQTQIEEVFSLTPKRILVVDDTFGGYRSSYATLALLETLYPDVDAYCLAGRNDLTDNLVTGWLEQFVPTLAKEIFAIQRKNTNHTRYISPWQEKIKSLITGTEDITSDSLDWKFISSESPAIKALEDYVPAEVALSAPDWAKTLACTYAIQCLKEEIQDDMIVDQGKDTDHLFSFRHLSLNPEERLAARAWLQGGVTSTDIVQIYGDSPEKSKKGFEDVSVKHEWQHHGQGRESIYFPIVSLDSWINIYYLSESSSSDIPVQGFAEFLPDKLWAGAYPISVNQMDVELFKDLLMTGVDCFIDLTNSKDFHRKVSYQETLLQVSHEINRSVEIKSFVLPFRATPARQQIQQVLDYITRSLKSGQRIYIHAGHNLDGRTPMILACLLIQRGYSADKALAEANAFWFKTLHYLIYTPLSEAQQKFILDW
jgi:hypothetical protein